MVDTSIGSAEQLRDPNYTPPLAKAVPLGISRIDVGESSGRLIFGPQPNVDPATIIQLIQAQPAHYSLHGSDKIRFQFDMASPEQRLSSVSGLLDRLSARAGM